MRLLRPFFRLPVRFDAERLRTEVASLPESAWAQHPNHIEGNSAVRLISVDGGENDDVNGAMLPTRHLQQVPYIRQVLASFGVVWSRSRLLRLAPGAGVPPHADINYHWFNRVRMHIPAITQPDVRFHCDTDTVHMAAGEAWVFDNWRQHSVENPTAHERIHLVADTSGSASFWQLVARSGSPGVQAQELPFDPAASAPLLTERTRLAPVMTPGEVDFLTNDLRAELVTASDTADARIQLGRLHGLLDGMCRDWRQLYALHGEQPSGWSDFVRLRDHVRSVSQSLGAGVIIRTNRVPAQSVLEGRILRAMLALPADADSAVATFKSASAPRVPALQRPVLIVAAPRSGSTLLFETLAVHQGLCTVGGEGHLLVESLPELQPGAPGVDSNRLVERHASPDVSERIRQHILAQLRTSAGRPVATGDGLHFLEKTPKNALRIPFFDHIFPDARFIFLWRDPRENLGSLIDAWRSGKWKTYNGLEGFDGPWSPLLPPGWQALNGRPLEEIAAAQWETANRIVMDDLASLPAERWTVVRYEDFIARPGATMQRLCTFIGLEPDDALTRRTSGPLPHSRYTLSAPAPDKWRRHEAAIERVMPSIERTWRRLEHFGQGPAERQK